MSVTLDIDLSALTPIGRSSYVGALRSTGRQVKIILAKDAEVVPMKEAAALRRRLVKELTEEIGMPVPFPGQIASGPCIFEGSPAWAFVNEYVPGADLTGIFRRLGPDQDADLVHDTGLAAGVSLAVLHGMSRRLVGVERRQNAEVAGAAWRKTVLARQETLVRRVQETVKITALSDRRLRRARSLAGAFAGRFTVARDCADGEAVNCWIHSDMHGGNVILDVSAPPAARIASFVDDQLSVGDGGYDIASIQSWAFEVLEYPLFETFVRGLAYGYRRIIPDYSMRNSDLLLYLVERSLGRLAYYARVAPTWVESYGAERIFRHVDLLGRIAGEAIVPDALTDPFEALRRLAA